jgi:hypothetical protein
MKSGNNINNSVYVSGGGGGGNSNSYATSSYSSQPTSSQMNNNNRVASSTAAHYRSSNNQPSAAVASAQLQHYDRVLSSINPNNHFMSTMAKQASGYSNIYDTINSIGYNNSSYLQNDLKNAQLEQALLTPNYNYTTRSKSVSSINIVSFVFSTPLSL